MRIRDTVLDLNPLALMAVGVGSVVASVAVRSFDVAVLALGVYALMILLFTPRWGFAVLCLAVSAIAAVSVVYSTWRLNGHDLETAWVAGCRILVLGWPGSVALGYADPARLGDYVAQTLRVPARAAAGFSVGLQHFAGFVRTWEELRQVRRMRGVVPNWYSPAHVTHLAGMAFNLLVQALRGATATALAMDARGFADAQERTWAEPATWSRADRSTVVVAVLLAALPWAWRLTGW